MWKRISSWLRRVSTGWVALSALVIFLLFSVVVLPRQSATADEVAGGAGSPDMSLYYSADDLYQMAEAYGEQGRKAYIRARRPFHKASLFTKVMAARIRPPKSMR